MRVLYACQPKNAAWSQRHWAAVVTLNGSTKRAELMLKLQATYKIPVTTYLGWHAVAAHCLPSLSTGTGQAAASLQQRVALAQIAISLRLQSDLIRHCRLLVQQHTQSQCWQPALPRIMSQRRKHVTQAILNQQVQPPEEGQRIVRALGSRGSNIVEVRLLECTRTDNADAVMAAFHSDHAQQTDVAVHVSGRCWILCLLPFSRRSSCPMARKRCA